MWHQEKTIVLEVYIRTHLLRVKNVSQNCLQMGTKISFLESQIFNWLYQLMLLHYHWYQPIYSEQTTQKVENSNNKDHLKVSPTNGTQISSSLFSLPQQQWLIINSSKRLRMIAICCNNQYFLHLFRLTGRWVGWVTKIFIESVLCIHQLQRETGATPFEI